MPDKPDKYTSMRVLKQTAKRLKLLAAIRDLPMLTVLDLLVTEDLKRRGVLPHPNGDAGKPAE